MSNKSLFPDQSHQIPIHISQQATEWYVKLQADNVTEQDFIAFERWLNINTLHQQAWQRLEDFGLSLAHIKHPLLQPALSAIEPSQSSKQAYTLKSILWLMLFGSSMFGLYHAQQQQLWQQWQADYKTRTGEQRHITLADGSQIILNTNTAINIIYDDKQRRIELIKGEIHIDVLTDTKHRPFSVHNRDGVMQDIGTTFNVRQYDDHSVLAVSEGEVKITTQHSKQVAHLLANQQIVFSKTAIQNIQALDRIYTAWTKGTLNVYKMPLPQFLNELNRYHHGSIGYDKNIQHLEVSGVFPVQDSEKVLQALQHGLPIKLNSQFFYWTKISLQDDQP
ncbi:FecR domain-containing protein [Acinetobacter puyangensis]|uniref:FecR family protein n=1 Tax=Acinetobacter puyangensis TaxID=1096779 RepID=A0A240EEW4_9GAMM|nr:FecR family protein [Acinetobacter puyangensis]SNX46719.1 FecR family protein [Acinetobacter puyangensis]